jgi:cytosine/adenosine deaminase-related metal-dependent hydrolase
VQLDDTVEAAREIGIRFHPTRGIMTLGRSRGGLPPDSCVESTEAALADAERLIRDYHDPARLSMLRMGVAPCSPFSVTDDCMVGAAALARRHPGVRLHTHLAENAQDIEFSLKTYGCRPGEYVRRVGWDRDDCWFAHCVMLDAGEMAQFAARGVGVCHCPGSNARLASGICPVRDLLDAGVNVGLGVDGSASNDSGNLLEQARWALLLQRGARADVAGMKVREALEVATKGGARNLGEPPLHAGRPVRAARVCSA